MTAPCLRMSYVREDFERVSERGRNITDPMVLMGSGAYVSETQTEIPCYELRRCIFEHGTHFTDGDIFACNSTTGVRQVGPSLRVGFAANVFHDGITEPLYSFRLPASLVKRASSSESPLETVLATNSTQIAYLTSKGYTLTKITGFLPNVSTTQDIELRYLYWKDMPPVDSVLAMDSEKKQYEAQGVWKLVDTVYVFAVQSNEKCSIAIGEGDLIQANEASVLSVVLKLDQGCPYLLGQALGGWETNSNTAPLFRLSVEPMARMELVLTVLRRRLP